MIIYITYDHMSTRAEKTYNILAEEYKEILTNDVNECNYIVAIGGDGFMLQAIKKFIDSEKPIYGINRGNIGFLLNEFNEDELDLINHIRDTTPVTFSPLQYRAILVNGEEKSGIAINEIVMNRSNEQTAHLQVKVNNTVRLPILIGDGCLVATPAGSTAYNLSAQGPIVPMGSNILTFTPLNCSYPRHWRGALIDDDAIITISNVDLPKRTTYIQADNTMIYDVEIVHIYIDREITTTLLFDKSHNLNDKFLREMFS